MIRLFLFCLVISWFVFHESVSAQSCSQYPPTNLSVTNITSCSAVFNWHSVADVSSYRVSYKVSTSNQWSANINVHQDTSYTFTGLLAGTKYNFRVFSKCNDGSKSKKVKKTATTATCTLPSQVSISVLNSHSVSVHVTTSCSYDSVRIRYSTPTSAFTYKSFIPADSFVVTGLAADSVYLFQTSTCPLSANQWTASVMVTMPQPPNIIFILLDDARYDCFSYNGAPSFFQTPSIDRIAKEGVNFKNTYCVTSLCGPSRATMATGLFTLKTGINKNGVPLDTNIITVPTVLKQHGYYTALVGKNHGTFLNSSTPEFNYWLWSLGLENNAGVKFNYNGNTITINGNNTKTLTDTALAVINRVNQPLFLWLAYQAPHFPLTPIPSFVGRYDGYTIPWPADTAKYTVNYPSFLYNANDELLHGYQLDTTYRDVLEVVGQLDSCIGTIINALEAKGELDNTLLIFTNDNGMMLGNHWIRGKTYAYEPSIKLPLLIRYPKWFADSSVIENSMALNEDIAPTIYDAAGVDYPYAMDGISLKKLYDGEATRHEFYYLMLHDYGSSNPTVRAIRDFSYKYVYNACASDTVEEFFDMVNDPLELTNLVNNHNYDAIMNVYRTKLDSIMTAVNDTITVPTPPCYIANPSPLKAEVSDNEDVLVQPLINPTLVTQGEAEIYIPWKSAEAVLFDESGKALRSWKINDTFSSVNLSRLNEGVYLLQLRNGSQLTTMKLVIAK